MRKAEREWKSQIQPNLFVSVCRGQLCLGYGILAKVNHWLPGRTTKYSMQSFFAPAATPSTQRSDLVWETLPSGPAPRLDAGGVQIGHLLYCIGGYTSQDHVLDVIDVFDLAECRWTDQIQMPDSMPQSHLALACESNRYIYSAGGQLGARCSPAVATALVFDTHHNSWNSLPSLPAPRYAPTMQLWRGRLHVMGGAMPDRTTPANEHWSLRVENGRPSEDEWKVERPIPRGGGHRASAVVANRLYLFGGQEGDFEPISSDPNCSCSGETIETVFPDSYRLETGGANWVRVPDMLEQSSHTEFSILVQGPLVIIFGGSRYKHPQTFDIELTDTIQVFDTRDEKWHILGNLPFRVKTLLTAFYEGWIYATAGQRDISPDDPRPGAVVSDTWRTRLLL